jgi:membrane protease YdiL (CAAX protease family)
MHASTRQASNRPTEPAIAVGIVIVLWVGYGALQTLSVLGRVGEAAAALLGLLPGILGVGTSLAAGSSRADCYLQIRPLSRQGLAVLVALFVFALAAILPAGVWIGWSWMAALVYAPASGIAQELFFRAALLPALERALQERSGLALILHSTLFGLWHIGPLFLGAPTWAVIAVMLVPFLSGIGWGWQVRHDRTVLWAVVQHSLIWVIGMQYAFPG